MVAGRVSHFPLMAVMVPPAGNVESSFSVMRNSPIAAVVIWEENVSKKLNSHTYHLSPEHIIITITHNIHTIENCM